MHIGIVTLFPEMFTALTDYGVSGRACRSSVVQLDFWNPRDFTEDRHRTVDDHPYGGGPGMLMKTEPLVAAIRQARQRLLDNGREKKEQSIEVRTVYLSPQGKPLNHTKVVELSRLGSLVLICGRYQGIDARVIEKEVDEEISLGDFVLSGGEIAAMAVVDALLRLQPGVLGDEDCSRHDTFTEGLLHCPQYTRPQEFEALEVPSVLLSGDHAAIAAWSNKQSLGNTWLKRPDLLADLELTDEQKGLLNQFRDDFQS
ncbi:MAG: tRNA (guanosine(37)-N1)-methyltransferase TrmD [Gammaproteobacteria bacterium]|nr:tRNA (guanosine(37)-N1)-methyltransferase TrmD [Gammaproteobacteria bacterium]